MTAAAEPQPLDLGPVPTAPPSRAPRPRLQHRPLRPAPEPIPGTVTPLAVPVHTARPVLTVPAPLLNAPIGLSAPRSAPIAPAGAVDRDAMARAVHAVLIAFGPGCAVIQTTPGIAQRCAALAEEAGR